MARFFIDRPVFAWVIAIIIMMAGALSIKSLPISQYPMIALPQVIINATYPGASAETLENTVTQLIEQKMNGIDNLLYMSSNSQSSGRASITLTFKIGTDPDIAQVQVQNKLQLAVSQLPQEVQQQGIMVDKSSATFLMVVGFVSEDGSMNNADIADYVSSNLQDPISRLEGVGQIQLFGAPYSMRIWLDPSQLNNYKLTIKDITLAIQAQNAQVSAGQLGGAPSVGGQELNATVTAQTRLQTPEQFKKILLRVNQDGSMLHLGDVARVEMGQERYDVFSRYNKMPATGISISLAYGANALKTAGTVKAFVESYSNSFPSGLKAIYPYDTTPFIEISIYDVFKTIVEAVILVFLVMFLFLQNFRATVIATITVPVVLLGTCATLAAFGFSINTLTMLAMVLAIGNLVDDAIVVIENVERVMSEEGLSPKKATQKSMDEITGALVGMALVLVAVFIPMAFFGGSTGVIYRQFSITMSAAMILSVVVAVVLTPALCATILKPVKKGEHDTAGGVIGKFFAWFNNKFQNFTDFYVASVSKMLSKIWRYIVIYGVLVVAIAYLFTKIPSAFFPDEDQGVLLTQIILPAGATQERTAKVVEEVEDYYLQQEGEHLEAVFAVVGFSFSGMGQNTAMVFVKMKDWSERTTKESKVQALANRAMMRFSKINDALVFPIVPPAVIELGNASGFDFQLQDRGNLGHDQLMNARNQFLMMAMSPKYSKVLKNVRHNGQEDTPEYLIHVDQSKSGALGIALTDINDLLQYGWGSGYVNDFIDKGRVKRVYMQAEAGARMLPEDLDKWFVRNNKNEMVPFSAFATAKWTYGSPRLERYNGISSVEIVGESAEGKSTGDAMKAVEEIVKQLPYGIDFEWTGLSLQEKESGDQATMLYIISMVAVFLLLAALYESWTIPLSVMLVVPLGIIGVQVAALLFNQTNDVYFQVGFLTIIGLCAKNAILIVEFAKALREEGKGTIASVLMACKLRIRPIMMTAMTFILGVLPLATSSGAGSGSHNAIGIGVVGGMLTNSVLGIFFVPLFFVMITKLFGIKKNND